MTKDVLFVTSPLEPELAARIRQAVGDRVEVIFEPDLLPPTRFVADHGGVPGFKLDAAQQARWDAHMARATILFDLPHNLPPGVTVPMAAPNVRWIQSTSSGIGQAMKRLGLAGTKIDVTNARGVHAEPLAEFVFAAFLHHIKRIEFLQTEQSAHRWERYCGGGLMGKSLLVVGAGKVGAQCGRIGQAFGMVVRAVVNTPSADRAEELNAVGVHSAKDLADLLPTTDFIVLCVPHTPDTEQMLNADMIGRMKPGIVMVNIARGQIINEAAMIAALRSGHIAFAGLDVAMIEPLPVDSPLWDMPNVLISPHSASTVESENGRIVDILISNLLLYLAGRSSEMTNLFNKERMY